MLWGKDGYRMKFKEIPIDEIGRESRQGCTPATGLERDALRTANLIIQTVSR